jgi:hypothetical protein
MRGGLGHGNRHPTRRGGAAVIAQVPAQVGGTDSMHGAATCLAARDQ